MNPADNELMSADTRLGLLSIDRFSSRPVTLPAAGEEANCVELHRHCDCHGGGGGGVIG